ncbi:MAG: hypothetical protein Q8Q00_05260 [Dehalococcoidia bacterium]|nr:hypothetical protein [Dehalococcoidia bacterium]
MPAYLVLGRLLRSSRLAAPRRRAAASAAPRRPWQPPADASGSSSARDYAAPIAAAVAGALALGVGGWYVRRRLSQ